MEKEFECIKIKDGLYIGNKVVACDLQFLLINKFAFVINCAAELSNLFEQHGIKYLKFKIHNDKTQRIFDQELKRLKKMKKMVQDAQDSGLCCLVHCNNNGNRSLVMITAYLMDRFKWKLRKAIQFLKSKGVKISLTESNIEQLAFLQLTLERETQLSLNWTGPFYDDEQLLITKTFLNTSKMEQGNMKMVQTMKKQFTKEEVVVEKVNKRVQWQDKIEKQQKKEKKRIIAEKKQIQKSREKIQEEILMKKQSKTHNLIIPKDKSDFNKKLKKRMEPDLDPQIRKQIQQAELMKLLKKSNKLTNKMEEVEKVQIKQIQPSEEEIQLERQVPKEEIEDKKVYKLTINNYINPNINIIKPPLDKKKKVKPVVKKQKDKFNRTFSEKQTFKKVTFYDKQMSRQKDAAKQKDKRNAGSTPVRSRKERKSEKQVKF